MNSSEGEVIWQVDWDTAPSPEPLPPAPTRASSPPPASPPPLPLSSAIQKLVRGQRVSLENLDAEQFFKVVVRIETPPGLVVDVACLGIDEQGRLPDDRYFIFYNQEQSPCGGIVLEKPGGSAAGRTLLVHLGKLPATISRLIVVAAIDGEGAAHDLGAGSAALQSAGQAHLEFAFAGQDFGQEKVLMLIEIYRKGGTWRVAALGQGFSGGLAALLQHHGASVV